MKPFEPYAHTHGQADRKLYDIEVAVSRIIVSCFKKKTTDQTTNTGKTLLRFCVCVCVNVCSKEHYEMVAFTLNWIELVKQNMKYMKKEMCLV